MASSIDASCARAERHQAKGQILDHEHKGRQLTIDVSIYSALQLYYTKSRTASTWGPRSNEGDITIARLLISILLHFKMKSGKHCLYSQYLHQKL
jgi:hypothetical protein